MKNLFWLSTIQGTPMRPRRRISPCGATATFGSALSLTYLASSAEEGDGWEGDATSNFRGTWFVNSVHVTAACLFDLVTYQFSWDSLKPPTRCFWTAICWHYPHLMPSILMLFGSNTTTWYRWVYIGCQHNISETNMFWVLTFDDCWSRVLMTAVGVAENSSKKTIQRMSIRRRKKPPLSHQLLLSIVENSRFHHASNPHDHHDPWPIPLGEKPSMLPRKSLPSFRCRCRPSPL